MTRLLMILCAGALGACGTAGAPAEHGLGAQNDPSAVTAAGVDEAIDTRCGEVSADTSVALPEGDHAARVELEGRYAAESAGCSAYVVDLTGAPRKQLLTVRASGQLPGLSATACAATTLHFALWGWVQSHATNEEGPAHWTPLAARAVPGRPSATGCTLEDSGVEPFAYSDVRVVASVTGPGAGAGPITVATE
jgi:hypothetical protein